MLFNIGSFLLLVVLNCIHVGFRHELIIGPVILLTKL